MCNVYTCTVEPLNKGHLGTQAAVPYSEVVPYWEVRIKLSFYELLQHFMNFYSISDIQNTLWCNKMVQSTLFQTRNIVRSNVI